jgi:hypothetical protein
MNARTYRAFISYSHRDSAWASWLHGSLEKYRPPKSLIGTLTDRGEVPKRLTRIFKDRDELPSANALILLVRGHVASPLAPYWSPAPLGRGLSQSFS